MIKVRKYVAKIIVDGFRLGKDFAGKKFIGVPTKYLPCEVTYNYNGEKKVIIDQYSYIDYRQEFDNKFGGGTYVLNYYQIHERK